MRLKEFLPLREEIQESREVKRQSPLAVAITSVFDQQAHSEVRVCRFHNSLIQQTMKPSTSANMVAYPPATATAIPSRKIITLRDSDRG